MDAHRSSLSPGVKLTLGFIAGALAVPTFHHAMLAILGSLGMLKPTLYSMAPTVPFGVPTVISLSFWGGVWGMIFVWFFAISPKAPAFYIKAIVFGAIALPLVSWFIVAPLKGLPIAAGWVPARMLNGVLINAGWGLGLGVFLALGVKLLGQQRTRPAAA